MKKIFVMLFCIIFVVSTMVSCKNVDSENNSSADLAVDASFFEDINKAYELGLMDGKDDWNSNSEKGVTVIEGITLAAHLHADYNNIDIEDREIELAFSKEDCTWKMTSDSAENPNMLLPDEMNLLIEMMKADKYFNGSNAEFLERYNAFSGKNLSARILKRMMNKWKYDLNDNHIYFKSYKENNIRKVEVKYDCENDNSDSEYVRYDKYDENIAV